jgi:di/tricarboxylate transporter
MVNEIAVAGLLGGVGGLVRGLVGIFKAMRQKEKFNFKYCILTIVIAIIIGAFTGIIVSKDYRVNLLAGYAGIDILEGLYKGFKR